MFNYNLSKLWYYSVVLLLLSCNSKENKANDESKTRVDIAKDLIKLDLDSDFEFFLNSIGGKQQEPIYKRNYKVIDFVIKEENVYKTAERRLAAGIDESMSIEITIQGDWDPSATPETVDFLYKFSDNNEVISKEVNSFIYNYGSTLNLPMVKREERLPSSEALNASTPRLKNSNKGIFAVASQRLLSKQELLSDEYSRYDLKIMRNEIYARHGYIFSRGGEMELYFQSQSWYNPIYENVDDLLSSMELENIQTITQASGTKELLTDNIPQLEDEAGGYGTIQVENLRLRSQPTMDAETVALLKKGSFVNVKDNTQFKSTIKFNGKEINDVWYNIITESNKTGWVHGCCIEVTWP